MRGGMREGERGKERRGDEMRTEKEGGKRRRVESTKK